jgi:hypothetical protein
MAEEMSVARGQHRKDQGSLSTGIGAQWMRRRATALVGAALVVLGLAASPAFAASTHPFKEEWPTGPNCSPREVATDAAGNVYVACQGQGVNERYGSLRKFSPTGTPISFTASESYVSGNEINENPVSPEGFNFPNEWGTRMYFDIDKSSARPGYIYVADYNSGTSGSGNLDIFEPSGRYVTSIKGDYLFGTPSGVGVDQDGYIYVLFEGCCGRAHISKYDPQTFKEILRLLPSADTSLSVEFHGPCCTRVRPDNTGGVWAGWGGPYFDGSNAFGKYEADQFNTNLNTGSGGKNANAVVAHTSPFLTEAFPDVNCPEAQPDNAFSFQCALKGQSFDVDLTNNDVYANEGNKITPYSQGLPGDPVHQDGPSFGEGTLTGNAQGIDIDNSGNVYVTAEPNKIVKFSRGDTLPSIFTKPPQISEIGHTTATVHGIIDPAGGGEITACAVSVNAPGSPVSCNEATPYPNGSTKEVSASLTGLTVGQIYKYKFEAGNAKGSNFGGERRFEAKAVLNLETKPATNIDENNATLNGQLDADGIETTYYYQYGPTKSYGLETDSLPITGASGELKSTPQALGHLQRGHTYHYRLVATNELGTTRGQDQTFRTASPPDIAGVGSENVLETSADLHASINPVGYTTTYRFEYGTTPTYGQSLPVGDGELTGNTPQTVTVHLTDLPPGTTIHYKVVAENQWGASETDDTTFNFRPPPCPNTHVRQLTGSTYLPDCRGYEIVSPGYAGAVQLLPGEALARFDEIFSASSFPESPQDLGYATSPSRFSYWGALGSILGIDAPNSFIDIYEATRTNTGWVTTFPGLKGAETKYRWGRTCSDSQDLCADYIGELYIQNPETGENENIPKSNSPFLYKADGTRLGRLPTNVGVVKGGTKYRGDQRFSGDFSHYIFSTQTKFTPDGLSTAPGSVYDNAIGPKTIEVISWLPGTLGGGAIPVEPAAAGDANRVTGIAGVSTDGSHVLMAGTSSPYCNINEYPFHCADVFDSPARLYMRVGNAVTYDVSRGTEVRFIDMTRDGSKVFFTTPEALLPSEDTDTSSDLYEWDEEGDELTLISQQGTLGNSDECTSTWTTKCGVEPLSPIAANYSEIFDMRSRVPGLDDLLANESGDIYFYSPEDLVPGEIGGDGQRNLYSYRNGELHLVATFEPGTQVERDTISQNGSHAAFVTKASLTSYDSTGHAEAYVYDADTNALRCASCNPAGTPPIGDVVSVSQGGPFMANDGRTFFATTESLVPQDTNGLRDVYEYVEGRPQLISSGTSDRDSTGGSEIISAFFGALNTGLESVSRNGVDVYFSTFDSLVPEDVNGSFLKMYDARTGGGFDFNPDLGNCAAADECHGGDSTPPAAPAIATGAGLGASGNVSTHRARKKAKRKRHRRHRKAHRHGKRHHKSNRDRSHRNG